MLGLKYCGLWCSQGFNLRGFKIGFQSYSAGVGNEVLDNMLLSCSRSSRIFRTKPHLSLALKVFLIERNSRDRVNAQTYGDAEKMIQSPTPWFSILNVV